VDVVPSLSGQCVTGGRLNLAKLLPAADVNTLPKALAWHRPDHLEGLIPSVMRTPSTIALSNTVTIFSGLKKFNNTNDVNTYGLVNQTGGWLFYRTSSAVSWSSNALAWHTNNGDYQFWKGILSNVPARTFQYYLQLDFDSGARTTYSHFTNNADGFATTTNQATAQSSPYTFTVPKALATFTWGGLTQTYNGSARSVTVTTAPAGLPTTLTYNASSSAPTNAGTYTVVATVNDSNHEGSASNTLSVAQAASTILTAPAASSIRFGQSLANSALSGGTSTPAGSFAFSNLATTPDPGLSFHGLTFTPTDAVNYLPASTNVSVTVSGVAGPSADPDGNGLPNLVEYALTAPSSDSSSSILPQAVLGPDGVLTLTALVRTNDPGLTYLAHGVTNLPDLGDTNLTTRITGTPAADTNHVPPGFQRQEFRYTNHASRAFLRLTIQQP
jgi:hypothetical protein